MTNLYQHQKENVQFHLKYSSSADWSEPGIGKSLIALTKIDILKKLGLVHTVLIVCPKTVMLTWDIEIRKHTHLSHTMLVGALEEKLDKLKSKSTIFLTTYDSIPGRLSTKGELFKALLRKRFDFLIADEITLIQNREAIRSKALTVLCDTIPRKLFASGTPITNNPVSIFNIYRALDGGSTFGKNFFAFRNKYFKNVGAYYPVWVPKEFMIEDFSDKIYTIAIRKTKDECLDLPPKVWSNRYTELSKEQREYYNPIASGILKDLETTSGKVKIKTTLDKMGKLSQIIGGFIYTDQGPYLFYENPKLVLLDQVVSEFQKDEKIIIYCRWREEIKLISTWCDNRDIDYVTLTGSTEDRASVVDKFQNGDAKILICNIAVGKYSLTLTSSSTIVYYSMGFGIEEFIQSSDRIHRISQSKTCLYIPLLIHNGIDEYIYDSISKKVKVTQSILTEEFKDRLRRSIK